MTKNKTILFIGKRLDPIHKAIELGYDVFVLTFKQSKLLKKPKKYTEILFEGSFEFLKGMSFDAIIPLTEKAVPVIEDLFKQMLFKKSDSEKFGLCHDKYVMKSHAKKHHIPITDFILVNESTEPDELIKTLGLPIVLKERDSSGSRGLTVVRNKEELNNLKPNTLAEKYVDGKEFSVETLVMNGEIIFINITEYHTHHICNIIPARIPNENKKRLLALNKQVIQAFGIKNGIAHTEYYLTKDQILFGEIAIRPPGGYIMKLIELSYGFNPWEALIQIESGCPPIVFNEPKAYSSVWILHPGEGVIEKEPDFTSLLNDGSLVDIQSGLKTGMNIKRREGSGEDYGRILIQSESESTLLSTIQKIKNCI